MQINDFGGGGETGGGVPTIADSDNCVAPQSCRLGVWLLRIRGEDFAFHQEPFPGRENAVSNKRQTDCQEGRSQKWLRKPGHYLIRSAKGTLRAASAEGTRGCTRARTGSVLRVFLRKLNRRASWTMRRCAATITWPKVGCRIVVQRFFDERIGILTGPRQV